MFESLEAPSRHVLAAFRLCGTDMHHLHGGEETSVFGAGVVLKRVQDPTLARWAQALLAEALPNRAFRLPEPIQCAEGEWEVNGWIATEYIDGLKSLRHDPALIIQTGEHLSDALTEALRGDSQPVMERLDRWAQADRFVWAEENLELPAEAATLATSLRHRISKDSDSRAVVHGDLSGNVFVDRSGIPVVLDFSPYIRPKRYASAIVVADNLLWYDGEPTLTRLIDYDEDGLARALLFRMVSEQLASNPARSADLTEYHRILTALGWD